MINVANLTEQLEACLANQDTRQAIEVARELDRAGGIPGILLNALFQQGRTWHAKGFYNEQKELCLWMLKSNPGYFETYHLLGFHAQMEGEFALAEAYYAQALSLNPEFHFSRLALSQLRMRRSHFDEGTNDYEARFHAITEGSGPDLRSLPIARWQGESIRGKSIYIWAEQGLGDIIMFASFLPYMIAQSPKRIVVGMFPRLESIFRRSFPEIEVESIDRATEHALSPFALSVYPQIEKRAEFASSEIPLERLEASYEYTKRHGLFDYATPMGDLLIHGFKHYVPVKHKAGYLKADAKRVEHIKAYLHNLGPGKKIGISWYTQNTREANRNIPLELWLPLLANKKYHFISLQHHVRPEDIKAFCHKHGCIIDVDHGIDLTGDAEGLLALVAAMDHVITIDNSNVHIAGALDVPTSLLLPKGHNFRWPPYVDKTYWYASVSTIRQGNVGDWSSVLAAAETMLARAFFI